jgi:hypothetical protein
MGVKMPSIGIATSSFVILYMRQAIILDQDKSLFILQNGQVKTYLQFRKKATEKQNNLRCK